MSKTIDYKVGNKVFPLDENKARLAFEAKKVINGCNSPEFNILPLKYSWAYDLYRNMKANHWEPEDIAMGKDIEQWNSPEVLSDKEKWIIRMGVGYFSAAEGIVGDTIMHAVREYLSAPELKLVTGRHVHEENIHTDSLLYMISSLGINPHEVKAIFEDIPSVKLKNEFVTRTVPNLKYGLDMTETKNKQLLAKTIFVISQVMEGTQFYGLFGMILSLYRQNKMTGIGEMFQYTLRDESNHIELSRKLLNALIEENPDVLTPEFKEELRDAMLEGVNLEKQFILDCLPEDCVGMNAKEFCTYIEWNANRRLEGCGLQKLYEVSTNPFPWLSEAIDLKKEKNFFESRVTEYRKSSSLEISSEDDLF